MTIEFIPPDFITDNDAEAIQNRMMNNLPSDIDNLPGGFPYDFTMPTAIEKSELIQFHLVRILMLMFPMWAWDEWLDYHAKAARIKRKEAGYATGKITIEGLEGTQILKGTIFATAATDEASSIEFQTERYYEIDSSGKVKVDIIAIEAGKKSNVKANTITLALKPIKGIIAIYNEEATTGGTEQEDDESLRERIQEVNESNDISYVGNEGDYKRWAKEVVGVGSAEVISEWKGQGTGSVKLIIMDANGQPANEKLIQAVYEHIMSPNDTISRKAPVGADLTIVSPTPQFISYSAKIRLIQDYKIEFVIAQFKEALQKYYEQAKKEKILVYTKIASILSETDGVADYKDFQINGQKENITIEKDEFPQTLEINFS